MTALFFAGCGADSTSGPGRLPGVYKRLLIEEKVSRARSRSAIINTIVIHFCSDVIANPKSPYNIDRICRDFERYGVGPHYLIDRKGVIYLLVNEDRAAFHAGKGALPWLPDRKNDLNDWSIGIELMGIGTELEMSMFLSSSGYNEVEKKDIGFTQKQYESLRRLIDNLVERYPSIEMDRKHIVGHDLYAPGRRTDPGALFLWSQIGL